MPSMQTLFERQAIWQKSRANLSWPEKIRQAEILRDTFLKMRMGTSNAHRPASAAQARKTLT